MSKFKLIKEYPGSPDIGTVVEVSNVVIDYKNYPKFWEEIVEETYWKCIKPAIYAATITKNEEHYIFRSSNTLAGNYHRTILEDTKCQPNSWLQCTKKDYDSQFLAYEIVSFQCKLSQVIWKLDSQLKGVYCTSDGTAPFFSEEQFSEKSSTIHSIRRKKDGIIISIGDTVFHTNNVTKRDGVVKRFYKMFSDIWVTTSEYDVPLCYIQNVAKEFPISRTSDGVDIYKGTQFYAVQRNTFKLIPCTYPLTNPLEWVSFSTKDKAHSYIVDNKPCLSVRDVLAAGYGICNPLALQNIVTSRL